MEHHLTIRVSKKPVDAGIVSYHTVTLRERILRFLLGKPYTLTVLVPGNSIKPLSIDEIPKEGGSTHEPNQSTAS